MLSGEIILEKNVGKNKQAFNFDFILYQNPKILWKEFSNVSGLDQKFHATNHSVLRFYNRRKRL